MTVLWIEIAGLGAMAAAAWGLSAWMARRGGGQTAGRLRLSERLAIDAKRSVCVVEVDGRRFLVAVGHDAMTLIAELNDKQAEPRAELRVVEAGAA